MTCFDMGQTMCILSAARVLCREPFVQIRERHHDSCVPCVQAIAEDKDYAEWCVWLCTVMRRVSGSVSSGLHLTLF